jgi:hypothetical protein
VVTAFQHVAFRLVMLGKEFKKRRARSGSKNFRSSPQRDFFIPAIGGNRRSPHLYVSKQFG